MLSEQTGCSSDSCSIFSVVWCGFTFVCHSWRQPDCSVPALGQILARSWGMEAGRQSAGGARARGGAGDRVMPWGNKGPCEQFPDHKGGAVYPPWWGGGEGRLAKVASELSFEGWIGVYRQRGRTLGQAGSSLRDLDWSSGNKVKVLCRQPRDWTADVAGFHDTSHWSMCVPGGLWAIEFAFYPVAWPSQKVFCGNPSPTSLWGTKVERS